MKKVLLSTSAIALMGAMTTAHAADWDFVLGGYMEQSISYVSNDSPTGTDFDGVHSMQDSEFYFRPEITLDNGIKVSARMDFEGGNGGGVDEPRMIISGSFGTLTLGEDDDAAADVAVTAPEVDFIGIVSGSDTNFYADNVVSSSFANGPFTNFGGDAVGIKYFTPRFAGFQVGVSYARDTDKSGTKQIPDIDAAGTLNNIFSVGANYTNSFGGVDLSVGGGYSMAEVSGVGTDDPTGWNLGASVGVAGFTLGGGYYRNDDTKDVGGSGIEDNSGYNIGVAYETGPWGVSATYNHEESDDPASTNDDERDSYKLAGSYKLAKGLTLAAWGIYMDGEDGAGSAGDTDAFVIGTGIKASF